MTTSATTRPEGFNQAGPGAAAQRLDEVTATLVDDGNQALAKFLLQHRLVPEEVVHDALTRVQKKNETLPPSTLATSLIDEIVRRSGAELEGILCGILERTKFAYIPLEYYDVDRQVVRMLPESITLSRLIVPFDVMSRTVMVATANPFDALGKDAAQQLLDYSIQWHLAAPEAICRVLQQAYRLGDLGPMGREMPAAMPIPAAANPMPAMPATSAMPAPAVPLPAMKIASAPSPQKTPEAVAAVDPQADIAAYRVHQ